MTPSKNVVILLNGDKVLVEAPYEIGTNNALIFKSGEEIIQVFAPGVWLTVFKAPAGMGLAKATAADMSAFLKN